MPRARRKHRRSRRRCALLEELGERELQQRERARSADDIADHGRHEPRLESHSNPFCRNVIASCSSGADIGVTANVAR